MYQFTINGVVYQETEDENLLEYLRETLRLTSVKNGCGEGACGACMVLVNGLAMRACLLSLSRLQDKTVITVEGLSEREKEVYAWFPRHVAKDGAHTYGTFAVRRGEQGFLTTSRGKKATPGGYALAHVLDVDHGEKRVVCHGQKATLNAPLLAKILEINPRFCIVLHGHDVEENTPEAIRVTEDYTFPGADNDLVHAVVTKPAKVVWMPRHGWWAGFENIDQMRAFIAQRNAAGAAHA